MLKFNMFKRVFSVIDKFHTFTKELMQYFCVYGWSEIYYNYSV